MPTYHKKDQSGKLLTYILRKGGEDYYFADGHNNFPGHDRLVADGWLLCVSCDLQPGKMFDKSDIVNNGDNTCCYVQVDKTINKLLSDIYSWLTEIADEKVEAIVPGNRVAVYLNMGGLMNRMEIDNIRGQGPELTPEERATTNFLTSVSKRIYYIRVAVEDIYDILELKTQEELAVITKESLAGDPSWPE